MKRLGQGKNEEETDIDITPMLDVVFIMLIFVIVTASFVKETALDVNKPPASNEPPPPDAPKPIVVEINEVNEIRIDDRIVDVRAVKPTITRMKAESPESSVIVKAAKKSKTRTVVQAIDGIREANVPAPTVSLAE